jgi:mono/diheme cytochrome c family protein
MLPAGQRRRGSFEHRTTSSFFRRKVAMKHSVWISIATLALALGGCGDDETATQDVSDILALTGDTARGTALFSTCGTSSCHGMTGSDGMGGDLAVRVPELDDAQLATIIRYGVDTPAIASSMPQQGDTEGGSLTAQDIADIMAFLREEFQ